MVRLSSVLGQLSIGGVFGMVEVGFMNDGLAGADFWSYGFGGESLKNGGPLTQTRDHYASHPR